MASRPNFTVCVIVKNGANTLPRLAKSLEQFLKRGGQWICVDTGSTDATVEVARSLGASVTEVRDRFMRTIDAFLASKINKRFVAEGDHAIVQMDSRLFHFAEARNFAASIARTDWVCWADADEAFTALDIDKIEKIIANPDLEHVEYDFVYAHHADGVTPAMNFTQSKMYRQSRFCWLGACHEVIFRFAGELPAGVVNRQFIPPDILHLEHWQEPSDHRSNYLPGLAWDAWLKLDSDPAGNRDRQWHYLARELMYTGRHRSAINLFEQHVAIKKAWPAERAQSLVYMGDCWGVLGEPMRQLNCYSLAFHLDSSRRVALLRLAGFYAHGQNWQASLCYATAALEIPWHGGFYADVREEYEAGPHFFIYTAAGWLGRVAQAQEHLRKALECQPWHAEASRDAKFYFEYDVMSAPEGWMAPLELLWLYGAAQVPNGRILEVGSWKGRSTHALCSGAAKAGAAVWAVDHWSGSVGEDAAHAEAKTDPDAVYRQFVTNTSQFDTLTVRRADSLEAAKEFPNDHFDLVFLDGSHDETSVAADIEAWVGKVKQGGILAGHDYCAAWPGVVSAVDRLLGKPADVVGSIWVVRV
jgi:glycosyltransferase involved in cell wall biosynthesis/predicted O-methyltransferase YrrM